MTGTQTVTHGRNDKAVSEFIDDFWQTHFRSPSFREIGQGCHITSTSVVRNTVQRIARNRGDSLATDHSARGITPKWVRDAITQNAPTIAHPPRPSTMVMQRIQK